MKEFKYKHTTIKVIKTGIASLKVDTIVTGFEEKSAKDFDSDEDKIRKTCFSVLNDANEQKFRSIAFALVNLETIRLPTIAIAKIMAQEVFRHIRELNSSLREIIFALKSEATFNCFKENVFRYLDHITYKVSQGPFSTVDIIVEAGSGLVLIERSNPPFGWALPGGFIDYGESLEEAARREAKEETSLNVYDLKQFHTYSEPGRDPRFHTISTVFTAKAKGEPKADSDAKGIGVFSKEEIKGMRLAFDHDKIIQDYFNARHPHNRR